ncbi:unnamed protein product [Ceutorhynchus assimilis]|uniref:Uncharacterized protein n=1 Tax=Ceutorhynchus assimilis TaxID=467358 RepID=A0A9N9MKH6_9CUCU|nr:unnamed protein product [Ceutorhynchus assimilis]
MNVKELLNSWRLDHLWPKFEELAEATAPKEIELPTEYNISESLEAYQIISTEENINLAEIEDIPIVFIADGPLSEEHEVLVSGVKGDYPPGTKFKTDTTHLDVFMLLFMLCTLEVVVLKIISYEEDNERHGISSTVRRSPVAMFFDRD